MIIPVGEKFSVNPMNEKELKLFLEADFHTVNPGLIFPMPMGALAKVQNTLRELKGLPIVALSFKKEKTNEK